MTWRAAFLLMVLASAARAELPREIVEAFSLTPPSVAASATADLQRDLLWIGHYRAMIDGAQGSDTRAAIESFQRSLGKVPTGSLTTAERETLARRASDTRAAMDLRVEVSDWTGMRVPLPRGYVGDPVLDDEEPLSLRYDTRAAVPFIMQQIRMENPEGHHLDPRRMARSFIEDKPDAEVLTAGTAGTTGYYMVRAGDLLLYAILETRSGETRSVMVGISASESTQLLPVVAEIFSGTDLFAGRGVAAGDVGRRLSEGRYPGAEGKPEWYLTMKANGSGSLISTSGHVLTNHHVIGGCDSMTVNGRPASLVGSDVRIDLALLEVPDLAGREPIAIRGDMPELGERIVVMGFPVFNYTQAMNVTEGIISSVVGFQGSRLNFQITAAVQPGNSGGPVLDGAGRQIAVVASKVAKEARVESNIENMAWVIRPEVVRDFLERYDVRFRDDRSAGSARMTAEIVADNRNKTLRVECH